MRHLSATCLATSLLLAAVPASAASSKSAETALAARAAQVAASAPKVRLAAYIATVRTNLVMCAVTVVRGKGVASATAPSCREVCITPSVALDLTTIVPVVSAEYTGSLAEINVAQWRSSGLGCPAGTIDIVLYSTDLTTGYFHIVAPTAFTIIVP